MLIGHGIGGYVMARRRTGWGLNVGHATGIENLKKNKILREIYFENNFFLAALKHIFLGRFL